MITTRIDAAIRRVPDFPKPGILFYDITGLLVDPPAFNDALLALEADFHKSKANAILAIEARGFLFAAPLAQRLGVPLVLARKPGKLPNSVRKASFNLEYGSDTLCIQELDLSLPKQFYIIDDLIATGGTLKAAATMLVDAGSAVSGIGAVIGLPFLGYTKVLVDYPVYTILNFHSE